jgi:hypothetical protein
MRSTVLSLPLSLSHLKFEFSKGCTKEDCVFKSKKNGLAGWPEGPQNKFLKIIVFEYIYYLSIYGCNIYLN